MGKIKGMLLGKSIVDVVMSQEALFGCSDHGFVPAVVMDTLKLAPEYVTSKEEGQRFTIVDTTLKMVVTGVVVCKDDKDLDLVVTNVYGDVAIVSSLEHVAV